MTMGSIEAPSLPDAFQNVPNPRSTALDIFDRLSFAFRVCFGRAVA